MKCKFCGEWTKIKANGFGRTCYDNTHSYTICENGNESLCIDGKEAIDNIIKMRAEHAEMKARIEELEKEVQFLTMATNMQRGIGEVAFKADKENSQLKKQLAEAERLNGGNE